MTMAQTNGSNLPVKVQNGEVVCSLQDSEGYWWYGGKGTGLCRYDGYETAAVRSDRQHPDLLRSNDVLCITEQKDNAEIWFGTKEGAYILSKKDYTVTPLRLPPTGRAKGEANELADKRISCIMTAADGSVWLTYRNQLLHFSAKAELLERFETMWEGKNRSVLSFCFDADSTLWAGLWNGGVICLKKERGARNEEHWKMEKRSWNDYPANHREKLTIEQQKQMLDSVMSMQVPTNDVTILSWAEVPSCSPKGEIAPRSLFYIGTYHSLYLYDGQRITLLQGDLDKVRSMAYSDKSQALYLLSKARGVCRWKDEKLEVILDSMQFRQLQLQGDTALLLSEGVAGVSMLNLRTLQLTADTTTADVCPIITSYIIDEKKQLMSFGQHMLSLPQGTDLVEISLSTFDFDHPSQVQFAYRLNEDEKWTELPEGEHIIKLAHLPAGTNHLQVRATDNFGRWGTPTTVLTLVRPSMWYEHAWLWVLVAMLILAGGYYLIRRGGRSKEQEVRDEGQGARSKGQEGFSVANQEFLDKAVAAISAHMTDSDYSVDALASDLCMSRANLHRKLRAINGQTPTDFIRNQRLERAAQLLRTTSHSVNEIADLVGFSYASYFTKCFKEKYGVLPKDY